MNQGTLDGPLLPLPQNENGTIVASLKSLRHFGFKACVFNDPCIPGGRPCSGARVIDPTINKGKTVLCCSVRREHVSADISVTCKMQQ
jgi:hypothetical protein